MLINTFRHCPLCNASADGMTFPYVTKFNSIQFTYVKCSECASVFVDPVPDSQTLSKMYAKTDYHDLYYKEIQGEAYSESAKLLKKYLPLGATVLDYGCGVGEFMKALIQEGFLPFGVELNEDAARFAGEKTKCETYSVNEFLALEDQLKFNAIHLGDVIEHLPDPAKTIKELLSYLVPGGVLFVEGPLEENPSLVCWVAKTFGWVKRRIKPQFIASHTPSHLFRTNAKQQLAFFQRTEPTLDLLAWDVYETGWPYSSGGAVKKVIAGVAGLMSGKRLFGVTFGNRFRGVFCLHQ